MECDLPSKVNIRIAQNGVGSLFSLKFHMPDMGEALAQAFGGEKSSTRAQKLFD
jgi:hypothetical protein